MGEFRAEVAGHDDDRVVEIDRAALTIGQATIFEDLQQRVPDVGVRLLDLVKEDHAVRAAADGFGQLTAFLIADVAGRRAKQAANGMLLVVFAHVDANKRVLIVKEEFGERAGQFGLADAATIRGR